MNMKIQLLINTKMLKNIDLLGFGPDALAVIFGLNNILFR